MARLDCPNPRCRKTFEVYETSFFECSGCGTRINVAEEAAKFEELESTRIADEKRLRVLKARLRIAVIFLVPILVGFLFRSDSKKITLLLAACLIWAGWQWIKSKRVSRSLLLAALCTMFLVGSIAGDLIDPPSARCTDGTYSYSANVRGTCSYHGGISEPAPEPWWWPSR